MKALRFLAELIESM